jgi:hypothetical protein
MLSMPDKHVQWSLLEGDLDPSGVFAEDVNVVEISENEPFGSKG